MVISKINKQKERVYVTIQIKEKEAVYLRVERHERIPGRILRGVRQRDSEVILFQVKTYKSY